MFIGSIMDFWKLTLSLVDLVKVLISIFYDWKSLFDFRGIESLNWPNSLSLFTGD
jgi:hypothetical protein